MSNPGSCIAGVAATLSPGCYTSIATTVTTLSSGNYYVTGSVNINTLSGSGVMIYVAPGGSLTATNNRSLTLSAPTSGTYSGVAIFQDRSNTSNFSTGNNFTLSVSGAVYMPAADVNFQNSVSFTSTGCFLFIAKSLTVKNGNGALTMNSSACAGSYSGAGFLSFSMAE